MNIFNRNGIKVKFSIGCVLALCLAWTYSATYAQEFKERIYVTGGLGVTLVEPESSTDTLTIGDNSDTGAHIGIGVDINRLLSLEVYAATLGEAQVDFLGEEVGTIDYTVFGYSALGYLFNSRSGFVLGDESKHGLFRREGASLYGRLGIGHLQNDSTGVNFRRDNPNHLAVGLGLEYGWENGFALRAEFLSLDTDAKYLSIGLLKRFGSAGALAVPALAAAIETPVVDAPKKMVNEISRQTFFAPIVPPNIYFDVDEADLAPEYRAMLDMFAERFAGNELRVKIEGHTDSIASERYNTGLSVRRAEAVANYLVSKGLERSKIDTVGFGELRPIDTNDTEEGRSLNRRADILLR